jgi:transposase InsO family protein
VLACFRGGRSAHESRPGCVAGHGRLDDGRWRRGKADAPLHRSDQGSQYTGEQFQRPLADNGITGSMSRAGNVWGNSAMESFFPR